MDRNQLIGLLLILAMFVGYQYLVPKPPPEKKPAQITKTTKPAPGSSSTAAAPLDSAAARTQFGDFATAAVGEARDIVIENSEVKVTFSTLGGRVKEVLLKKYKTFDNKPLLLVDAKTNRTVLELPTKTGKVDLHELYYQTTTQSGSVSGQPQVITFRADAGNGQAIEQSYTVPATGYAIDYALKASNIDNVPANAEVRFLWEDRMPQFENDLSNNRRAATINYLTTKDNFDHLAENESSNEAVVEDPVKWFAIKHKYFLSAFIAQNTQLNKAKFQTVVDLADSSTVKTAIADVSIPLADIKAGKGQFRYYYGPNDFQIIKEGVAPDFDQNVYLGYSILKPINKYFFVPVFNFMGQFITNYGLLIIALVV
ncbi:MAG: membrane protein insertase YidC, partial [Cytophagaceae bacterium]